MSRLDHSLQLPDNQGFAEINQIDKGKNVIGCFWLFVIGLEYHGNVMVTKIGIEHLPLQGGKAELHRWGFSTMRAI
jgi:hypothetical protein